MRLLGARGRWPSRSARPPLNGQVPAGQQQASSRRTAAEAPLSFHLSPSVARPMILPHAPISERTSVCPPTARAAARHPQCPRPHPAVPAFTLAARAASRSQPVPCLTRWAQATRCSPPAPSSTRELACVPARCCVVDSPDPHAHQLPAARVHRPSRVPHCLRFVRQSYPRPQTWSARPGAAPFLIKHALLARTSALSCET